MFTVPANFIGNFKTGDNIHYNLRLLRLLYLQYEASDDGDKALLRKPIIISLVSVVEAMLHDLHMRVQVFTIEGVENLADDIIDYIRGKRLEEFEKYIASARKHDFFDSTSGKFYDRMDELRRLRNRVHIQNSKGDFEPDDEVAFSITRKDMAEKVLEKTAKTLSTRYSRPEGVAKYVADFEFPWKQHLP